MPVIVGVVGGQIVSGAAGHLACFRAQAGALFPAGSHWVRESLLPQPPLWGAA